MNDMLWQSPHLPLCRQIEKTGNEIQSGQQRKESGGQLRECACIQIINGVEFIHFSGNVDVERQVLRNGVQPFENAARFDRDV